MGVRVDSSVTLTIWKRASLCEGRQQCQVNNLEKDQYG